MTAWRKASPWHLEGPEGWTIAKIVSGEQVQYELWLKIGWNDSECRHRSATAEECKTKYEEMANG